jgi:hypothetical protein
MLRSLKAGGSLLRYLQPDVVSSKGLQLQQLRFLNIHEYQV